MTGLQYHLSAYLGLVTGIRGSALSHPAGSFRFPRPPCRELGETLWLASSVSGHHILVVLLPVQGAPRARAQVFSHSQSHPDRICSFHPRPSSPTWGSSIWRRQKPPAAKLLPRPSPFSSLRSSLQGLVSKPRSSPSKYSPKFTASAQLSFRDPRGPAAVISRP